MNFLLDKLSSEKALFAFVIIAGYIFSIIDSLFFGYYLWIFFGPYFFLMYFFCSVPFVFISRLNNYAQIYEKINLKNMVGKAIASPWSAAAALLLFMVIGYLSYNLYIIYYGSWVIQILKLLRDKMGFTGMEWIRILVFVSLIPEALSFCLGLLNNIAKLVGSMCKNVKSMGLQSLIKKSPYILLSVIAIAGAVVLSQISASYIMLTYQQYLMEFYKASVPTIKNKASIVFVLFMDMFFTIKQFFESFYKTYKKEDVIQLKNNYYSYVMLCFTMLLRAISKIVLAVGIATSPWHFNIKFSVFMQSIFDDFLSTNNSENSYAKDIMHLAILCSLLNVFLYAALIYSGHAQISLTYAIISISATAVLSVIIPKSIYNTNNKSIEVDNNYADSGSFYNRFLKESYYISSGIRAAVTANYKEPRNARR